MSEQDPARWEMPDRDRSKSGMAPPTRFFGIGRAAWPYATVVVKGTTRER